MILFCRWLSTVDDNPGVCAHVLDSLKKSKETDNENYNHCVLLVDEMSIKKHTTWVPSEKKFVGHVELGGEVGQDTEKMATNALVVMAVGLKKNGRSQSVFILQQDCTPKHSWDVILQRARSYSDTKAEIYVVCWIRFTW